VVGETLRALLKHHDDLESLKEVELGEIVESAKQRRCRFRRLPRRLRARPRAAGLAVDMSPVRDALAALEAVGTPHPDSSSQSTSFLLRSRNDSAPRLDLLSLRRSMR
jgi:hypothetical protein